MPGIAGHAGQTSPRGLSITLDWTYRALRGFCVNLRDLEAAKTYTRMGLERQPKNDYCQALAKQLKIRV